MQATRWNINGTLAAVDPGSPLDDEDLDDDDDRIIFPGSRKQSPVTSRRSPTIDKQMKTHDTLAHNGSDCMC